MKFDIEKMSLAPLYYHFSVYGHHEAGVLICDKANRGDKEALFFAEKIWETAKEARLHERGL